MKHFIYIIAIIFASSSFGQVARVSFSIPDTICAEELFSPKNTSTGTITSYFWHFCSGNLSYAPSGVTLPADPNLKGPAFMAIAEDSGRYYVLISNHGSPNVPSVPPSIVLYRFGNSLLNNPASQNFGNIGNMIPEHMEGVQLKKDNGNWYGFIIGGIDDNARLIRLDFGTSLENTPTPRNLGNFNKSLDYPVDLYLFEENGMWIGYTANYSVNTDDGYITRLDFGTDLSNTPIATNINNLGLHHPCGVSVIAENGVWYMFIANLGSSAITRLTFGNSLTNRPVVEDMGQVAAINSPFDITFTKDCNQVFGFTVNRYDDDLVRLDFPQGLGGKIIYTSLGSTGTLSNPHGLTEFYRVDNEVFTFVANSDNSTISRLYYETCDAPSTLTSNLKEPSPLYYRTEGHFNISLILDQGLPTEQTLCKNIVVTAKPTVSLPNDTTICPTVSLKVEPVGSEAKFYKKSWSTRDTAQAIMLAPHAGSDSIWLEVINDKGCKAKDTMIVTRYADDLWLGNDTSFTIGIPITLDARNAYPVYSWSTGEKTQRIVTYKPGDYGISATDINGCIFTDTIRLTLNVSLPNFFTPNGDTQNDRWEPKLFNHYPEAEIKIFDRYGKQLTKYRGSDNGWSGFYNGRLVEPDTYWYVVDLKNGTKPLTGQITIKH